MPIPTRNLAGTPVSAIGFGAMGISAFYGATDPDEERYKVLDTALAEGCTFWDTADVYQDSEDLLGRWFKRTGKRDQIFLATKFGVTPKGVNGTPEYAKSAIERSLSRLGVDYVDLYYLHRADVNVPIEKSVEAMAEMVKAGKVKHIGLSEISSATLRRAYAVHPIAAVQVEYSPFTLDIEDEKINLLATCRELGVTVVAYSPLGRGFLTGRYKSPDDLEPDDWRRNVARYSAENFPNILKLVDGLKTIGDRHGASPGQVALAWLLAQGNDIIPIPGTKKIKYLVENIRAADIKLSPEELEEVRQVAEKADAAQGDRYPTAMMGSLFVDTPPL